MLGKWDLELEFPSLMQYRLTLLEGKVPSDKPPNPDLCGTYISYLLGHLSSQLEYPKSLSSSEYDRFSPDCPYRPFLLHIQSSLVGRRMIVSSDPTSFGIPLSFKHESRKITGNFGPE